METHFSRNLKYLREQKNVEQLELAHLLGRKSASSISEWEKGTYTPKSGTLSDIARIFNVNLEELMNVDLSRPTNVRILSPQTRRIPIVGKIACGESLIAEQNVEGYIYKSPDSLPSGELFALIANGDSMEPTIPNGAIVLLREQQDVENGEVAAVLLNGDEEATLKRVHKDNGSIWLVADNTKYGIKQVTEDYPVRIIGKAVSFEMKL